MIIYGCLKDRVIELLLLVFILLFFSSLTLIVLFVFIYLFLLAIPRPCFNKLELSLAKLIVTFVNES